MVRHSSGSRYGTVSGVDVANRFGCVRRASALVNADRPERSTLKDANQLQADHLEHRQERHDHAGARLHVGEQILEAERFILRQALQQLFDSLLDRNLLARKNDFRPLPRSLDD
jgi:hypothetical protein